MTTFRKDDDCIHIETDGCIINIRPGLYRDIRTGEDKPGYNVQKVTAVEVIPDGDTGDRFVWGLLDDEGNFHEGAHSTIRVARRMK